MRLNLIIIVCFVLLSACSSLPRQVQPQEKKNADLMLISAQKYEHQHRYPDAAALYQALLPQYRAIGETEGQLVVLAGLARICLVQDSLLYSGYVSQMQNLVNDVDSHKSYHLQILELYRLHQAAKWEGLSALATVEPWFPETAVLQILTYKVQSDAYLQHPNTAETARLKRLISRYHRLLRSRKYSNPELVANAAYSVTYQYLVASNYQKAEIYVQQAQQIDYAYGLFYSYAYDLWLEAQIAIAQGDKLKAIASLAKARDIFEEFQDYPMQAQATAQIEQLKGR